MDDCWLLVRMCFVSLEDFPKENNYRIGVFFFWHTSNFLWSQPACRVQRKASAQKGLKRGRTCSLWRAGMTLCRFTGGMNDRTTGGYICVDAVAWRDPWLIIKIIFFFFFHHFEVIVNKNRKFPMSKSITQVGEMVPERQETQYCECTAYCLNEQRPFSWSVIFCKNHTNSYQWPTWHVQSTTFSTQRRAVWLKKLEA